MTTCPKCGGELRIGDYPFCRGSQEDHIPAGSRNAQRFDPVVYFQGPGGKLAFPGRTDQHPPKGYKRVELTTTAQVRRFEAQMTHAQRIERQQEQDARGPHRERAFAEQRRELRIAMERMSAQGRDLARAAMDANNRRPGGGDGEFMFAVQAFN
jgi:hypothetical protein